MHPVSPVIKLQLSLFLFNSVYILVYIQELARFLVYAIKENPQNLHVISSLLFVRDSKLIMTSSCT